LGKIEEEISLSLSPETERLLGEFLILPTPENTNPQFSEEDIIELRSLILDNSLEENSSYREARDYILKLVERDSVHPDLPQVLYNMMTHIRYYKVPKEHRINAQNRDIEKTAATICSLCQFALGEKKRG